VCALEREVETREERRRVSAHSAAQDFDASRERVRAREGATLKGGVNCEKVLQKGASGTHTCTEWVLKRRKSPNRANEQGGDKFQLRQFLLAEHDTFRGLPLAFN
jgi:hypothetical protein